MEQIRDQIISKDKLEEAFEVFRSNGVPETTISYLEGRQNGLKEAIKQWEERIK